MSCRWTAISEAPEGVIGQGDSYVASASRPEALLDFAERVEAGSKWSSAEIHEMARAVYGTPNRAQIAEAMMAVQGDLSSVVSLLERVLPGANCHGYDKTPKLIEAYVSRNCIPAGEKAWMVEGFHPSSPARALLAATLRALADAHKNQRTTP